MGDVQRITKRWKATYGSSETIKWRNHWKKISEYFAPRSGKFLTNETEESNKGERGLDTHVINTTPYRALDVAAAGLTSGLTSPTRPWFSLGIEDSDLMEFEPVRHWLQVVRDRMLNVFRRSNFYGSVHNMFRETILYGYNPMIIDEDMKTTIRCRPMTIGEAYITLDSNFRPDGLYRQFWMYADQVEQKFGDYNLPATIKTAIKAQQYSTKFLILHAIEPTSRVDKKNQIAGSSYMSTYFWVGSPQKDDTAILAQWGHRSKPFMAPRWDVVGSDTYGDSPCIKALSDNLQLQRMEEDKLKALDKMVDPPMNAPESMRHTGGSIRPADINYVNVQQGQQGFTPTLQVKPAFTEIAFELDRIENRIDKHLFKDLFLAILDEEKSMTATEVSRRFTEKLQILGPALDRLQGEALDVVIDRTFAVMLSMGQIPDPPEEMQGADLKVEYISVLAQAQKMVGLTAIEQTAGFIGSLVAVVPEAIDKLDADQAIDEYAEQVGVTVGMIRSDDEVAEIRDARAKAAAAAAAQEQAMAAAQGAKTLSEAKVGEQNMLTEVLGG